MSAAPPVPALAATVMLLREAPWLEVLMVRRGAGLAFGANALVFPGGRLDRSDGDKAWREWAQGARDLPAFELGLRVAAARELFEETGVLLAGAGPAPGPAPEALGPLGAALAQADARLDLGGVGTFARWITPTVMPKRFDTYFFIARAPEDCEPICDGHEAVDVEWIAPGRALALADKGERALMAPTRKVLERLVLLDDLAGVEQAVAAYPEPEAVEPTILERADVRYIAIPATRDYGPAVVMPLPVTGG